MRIFFSGMAVVALAACGGNVVVDTSGTGGGGAGGAGGASSATTSSSSSSTTTSSSSSSSGTSVPCPDPFPGVEATCTEEGQVCEVPLSCCGGQATCTGGLWTYQQEPCGLPCSIGCGPDGFSCGVGAVCVALIGETTKYQCAQDPCGGAPLACACAGSLCTSWMLTCNNIQQGFKVLCD